MMKILIATGVYPPEIGGPATYTALIEKEFSSRDISVFVIPFRIVRHLPKVIRHLVYFFKVLSFGRKADILYAQDPVSVGFPTMLAAKILRRPFIIRVAGDYAWEQSVSRFGVKDSIDDFQKNNYSLKVKLLKKIQTITTNSADKIITPSLYFKDLVSQWVRDKNKVVHVYNGIDLTKAISATESFRSKTLISAGRLLPWKGFDVLISVLKKIPDWELYIAGSGPELENLIKLSKKHEVNDRVKFLGSLPNDKLIRQIKQSEIFILNTSFESFSFQIVEAMSVGVPVISTKIGNISEIIEDNHEGILVEPNNEEAIISAIQKIHNDKALREKIISNALEKVKLFSVDSTVEKTLKIINEVIKN